jgi:hypothetical protein
LLLLLLLLPLLPPALVRGELTIRTFLETSDNDAISADLGQLEMRLARRGQASSFPSITSALMSE